MLHATMFARITALIGIFALLCSCLEPSERGSLMLQLRGPPNPRARCAKGPIGMGVLQSRGEPVSGARVMLSPGGFSGTTNAEGQLLLEDLPEDLYTVRVTAEAFQQPEDQRITIVPGQQRLLTLDLSPCIFGGGHKFRVGFGTSVSLAAASMCDGFEGATFTWSQVEGPDVRDSVADWNRQDLTFTTRELEQVRPLPDEPQILSFSPDQVGAYVFRVTGQSKRGTLSTSYVLVTSTDVASGGNSVPPNNTIYFLGKKQGPWKWVIDEWPANWTQTLRGEETRTPSVLPVPFGSWETPERLTIRNEHSNIIFTLIVSPWNLMPPEGECKECHQSLFSSWEKTRHASTWKKLLDGELSSGRSAPAESCATCHSMGYDRSASSGGYDDVAKSLNVPFTEVIEEGTYAQLPEDLQRVSNVFCTSCHGPGRTYPLFLDPPGKFAVGICARCHDRLPEQDLVAQWRTSRMSQTIKGVINGPDTRQECARCHTAQNFYLANFALTRPVSSNAVSMICCDNLAPITCQACHSPMYATNKAQVFRHGSVTTKGGITLSQVGSGALCATCHNTEHNVKWPSVIKDRLAPHSPQMELSYGRSAAYILDAPASYPVPEGAACSRDTGDGCVTCHMDEGPDHGQPGHRQVGDHTFHMVSAGGVQNVRPCQACHENFSSFDPRARGDYDGDAEVEGVRDEVKGLMELLRARLSEAIQSRGYVSCGDPQRQGTWIKTGFRLKVVVTDEFGFDLGDCDRNGYIERLEMPFVFPDGDLNLHKAAYNYLLIERDKSLGLHNVPYTVALLQRTLFALTAGKGLPQWDLFQSRR